MLIADDHDIVRAGIRHLLSQQSDIEVVGEASDGRGVVQLAERLTPQVVIMDIAMPNLNGMEAASQILRRDPKMGVIILSMHEEEDYLMRALAVGVRGYLLKESAQTDLVPAVRAVAGGKTYFSPPVAQMLADDFGRQLQQRGISRFLRSADRTGARDSATDRGREIEQRGCGGTAFESLHRGDTSNSHHAEARPAQYGGDRVVRRTKENYRLD